jgi:RNA polymerase sigma-70 factor (ECF subfamily)
VIGEADLVQAARAGDPAALGAILERHRASLLATAFRMVGYRSEAEDAVHDAFLIALRRIDTLEDPQALRGWLDAIVRNVCRTYLRGNRLRSLDTREGGDPVAVLDDPGAPLDRMALRDWIWKALEKLPESLRLTVLLRHFGNYSSYEEIAETLAVPLGTVRSRLSEARRKLSEELLGSSRSVDEEERRRRETWNRYYVDAFARVYDGRRDDFISHYCPDVEVIAGKEVFRGRAKVEQEVDGDLETGTLSEPVRVLTSGNLTVIDCKITNPPDDPARCPQGMALVVCRQGDRSHRVYLYPGQRVPLPADFL